jgi:hypothetical protein
VPEETGRTGGLSRACVAQGQAWLLSAGLPLRRQFRVPAAPAGSSLQPSLCASGPLYPNPNQPADMSAELPD